MRKRMLACAAAALMSGVMSVILWRDLRHERELNAQLLAQLADARVQPAPAGSGRSLLTAAPAAPDSEDSPPARSDGAADADEAEQQFRAKRREQLNDPEYRMKYLAQRRQYLIGSKAGLSDSLGLTAAETDKLFGILAERDLALRDVSIQVEDLPEGESLAARENAIEDLNRKRDEALAALLGPTRLQQFENYSKEQSGWAQIAELNRMLDRPLSVEQSRPLATMLASERQRMAEALGTRVADSRRDPAAQAQLAEEVLAYQAQANTRTLSAASQFLTVTQLEALRKMFEQQEQLSRSESRFLRNMTSLPRRQP